MTNKTNKKLKHLPRPQKLEEWSVLEKELKNRPEYETILQSVQDMQEHFERAWEEKLKL